MQRAWSPGAEELPYLDALWSVANEDRSGRLQGAAAVAFFKHSGLDVAVLRQVWSLADVAQQHFLGKAEFDVAMRLIAMAQHGLPVTSDALVAQAATKLPLPRFAGLAGTYSITEEERSNYERLFPNYDPNRSGFISGPDAANLFTKSGLDRPVLKKVWDLADVDKDYKLTVAEFTLAMHLIVCISKRAKPLPDQCPIEVMAAVGLPLPVGGAAPPPALTPPAPTPTPTPAPTPAPQLGGLSVGDAFGDIEPPPAPSPAPVTAPTPVAAEPASASIPAPTEPTLAPAPTSTTVGGLSVGDAFESMGMDMPPAPTLAGEPAPAPTPAPAVGPAAVVGLNVGGMDAPATAPTPQLGTTPAPAPIPTPEPPAPAALTAAPASASSSMLEQGANLDLNLSRNAAPRAAKAPVQPPVIPALMSEFKAAATSAQETSALAHDTSAALDQTAAELTVWQTGAQASVAEALASLSQTKDTLREVLGATRAQGQALEAATSAVEADTAALKVELASLESEISAAKGRTEEHSAALGRAVSERQRTANQVAQLRDELANMIAEHSTMSSKLLSTEKLRVGAESEAQMLGALREAHDSDAAAATSELASLRQLLVDANDRKRQLETDLVAAESGLTAARAAAAQAQADLDVSKQRRAQASNARDQAGAELAAAASQTKDLSDKLGAVAAMMPTPMSVPSHEVGVVVDPAPAPPVAQDQNSTPTPAPAAAATHKPKRPVPMAPPAEPTPAPAATTSPTIPSAAADPTFPDAGEVVFEEPSFDFPSSTSDEGFSSGNPSFRGFPSDEAKTAADTYFPEQSFEADGAAGAPPSEAFGAFPEETPPASVTPEAPASADASFPEPQVDDAFGSFPEETPGEAGDFGAAAFPDSEPAVDGDAGFPETQTPDASSQFGGFPEPEATSAGVSKPPQDEGFRAFPEQAQDESFGAFPEQTAAFPEPVASSDFPETSPAEVDTDAGAFGAFPEDTTGVGGFGAFPDADPAGGNDAAFGEFSSDRDGFGNFDAAFPSAAPSADAFAPPADGDNPPSGEGNWAAF